jgi:hypothetical protein
MIETPAHHGATSVRRGLLLMLAMLPAVAQACRGGDSGETAIFRCEASHGKKYVELCLNDGSGADDSSAPDKRNYLVYRFGSLDDHQDARDVELEFPARSPDSFKKFFGAIYDSGKWHTQSVRFVSGNFDYIVFTHSRGATDAEAADESSAAREDGVEEDGVEIHDRTTGKRAYVRCSERPRFYIHELKELLACDKETPVGTACIR